MTNRIYLIFKSDSEQKVYHQHYQIYSISKWNHIKFMSWAQIEHKKRLIIWRLEVMPSLSCFQQNSKFLLIEKYGKRHGSTYVFLYKNEKKNYKKEKLMWQESEEWSILEWISFPIFIWIWSLLGMSQVTFPRSAKTSFSKRATLIQC